MAVATNREVLLSNRELHDKTGSMETLWMTRLESVKSYVFDLEGNVTARDVAKRVPGSHSLSEAAKLISSTVSFSSLLILKLRFALSSCRKDLIEWRYCMCSSSSFRFRSSFLLILLSLSLQVNGGIEKSSSLRRLGNFLTSSGLNTKGSGLVAYSIRAK